MSDKDTRCWADNEACWGTLSVDLIDYEEDGTEIWINVCQGHPWNGSYIPPPTEEIEDA